jgi:hypothetical protein
MVWRKVRQATGRSGFGQGSQNQGEIECGRLQDHSLGDIFAAAHVNSTRPAGLILICKWPPQKFAGPPQQILDPVAKSEITSL